MVKIPGFGKIPVRSESTVLSGPVLTWQYTVRSVTELTNPEMGKPGMAVFTEMWVFTRNGGYLLAVEVVPA